VTLPGVDAPERSVALSQYFTPPETAERIARFAMHPWFGRGRNPNVIEPSCGDGALLRALGGYGLTTVLGLDIDPANIELCRKRAWSWPPKFVCADFLEWSPSDRFDIAVMNPPFEREQAMQHVLRGLEVAGHVVAHVPLTTLAGKSRNEKLWQRVTLTRLAICATRPKYGPKGGATEMCTIDVRKRVGLEWCETKVEWWP
jgi:SAM-dependent methyltransferase